MRINLFFKNLIILVSITALLNGSSFVNSTKGEKDYKDTYGVELVLAK